MNWDIITVPQGQAKASSLCTSGEEKKYAMSVEDNTKFVRIYIQVASLMWYQKMHLSLYILAT